MKVVMRILVQMVIQVVWIPAAMNQQSRKEDNIYINIGELASSPITFLS
jgi:hypothetical protein